jgi:hypothetical protein
MSSPLAIAAVTAALKDLLNDGLLDHDLSTVGSFSVTALPPDRITTGQTEPNQLNLFLYQVTPNLGWRNEGLPSRDRTGVRLSAPPLALDLHYLLTAYGSADFNAEILLGYAMQLLHENPVLTRAQLRIVLGGQPPVGAALLPSPFGNLSALDLADQPEMIKISPVFLTTEELSKMWTAMQARYRPTMAYTVSVVLIQSTDPGRVPLPVLTRGPGDAGPTAAAAPAPVLSAVRPAASDLLPAMQLGDDLLVTGTGLTGPGTVTAILENARAQVVRSLTPAQGGSATRLPLHLPSAAEDPTAVDDWAVGTYTVALRVARPDSPEWTTNAVPIGLAPRVVVAPTTAAPGDVDLTLTCAPRLRPDQHAGTRLIVGSRSVAPTSVTTPADRTKPTTLAFTVPALAAGEYLVRLRVDGIDSLPVTLAGTPPTPRFDPQQRITVE